MRTLFPDDHGVLEISGRDARAFLQAQLATDMRKHGAGAAPHAALLGPNGRVLAVGTLLINAEEQFWWLLDRQLIDAISQHLGRFRLRSKVMIEARPHLQVCARVAEAAPHFQDYVGRNFLLGTAPDEALDPQLFAAIAIQQGMLDFAAEHTDRHLPQALGLHRSGAIALGKGCYPGQEIVARTHYLGRVKRSLALFHSDIAPVSSELLGPSENVIGELLNLLRTDSGYVGLATVHTESARTLALDTERQAPFSLRLFD